MHENDSGLGLDRFPYLHTRDLDVARQGYRRINGEAELDAESRRFEWRVNFIDLGQVSLSRAITRGGVVLRGESRGYFLNLSNGGHGRVVMRGERVDIVRHRSAMMFSPTGIADVKYDDDEMRVTTLRVDSGFLMAELEAFTGLPQRRLLTFSPQVRIDRGAGASLTRLCMALLDELSRGSEALAHPLVAHSLGQALARQLLFGQPHDLAHLLDKPAPPSSRTVVRMVEEYLEAHATEAIRVADLAALTGASVRSIEAAFRAQRGSTPGAFLRGKRLMLARQRLLASEPGVTATHVAYATGFLRRARFDAAYLQQFGETPDETQRRGLIANGAPPSSASRPSPVPASARGSSEERGDLATRFAALSPRERQVCEGVGRGMLNKQIAADLGISERTVKDHRARGMARLGVTSAAELGRLLERLGG